MKTENDITAKYLFFVFQAEDGIRDATVTGVQTCALPICSDGRAAGDLCRRRRSRREACCQRPDRADRLRAGGRGVAGRQPPAAAGRRRLRRRPEAAGGRGRATPKLRRAVPMAQALLGGFRGGARSPPNWNGEPRQDHPTEYAVTGLSTGSEGA